ncbi:hypothetical protein BVG16_22610 [Paenibacillus selenitireducens]|uniref:methylated-DNA--[protein]-cysteine S-methyltransferase n=1 Tax=Paenibacillus selenitireducens TaxID=1324314 RepID=A0A1T2X3U5_9BACL|nr:methylated-DNA--[protein]-cysteine S-methyltransferase [Paenibacillus selenitireducens]OPA74564.1 hypothetical protein BVG16_22610 [Paenibacillus selenitireducens]
MKLKRSEQVTTIYWTELIHQDWKIILAATDKGLCYVGGVDQSLANLQQWASSKIGTCEMKQDEQYMANYMQAFRRYLAGECSTFTCSTDLYGTPFQQSVWQALLQIPYGSTYSYSELADQLGRRDAVRAVSTAIGANPVLIAIPCHRVIGKNGSLTGFRGGLPMKEALLHLEQGHVLQLNK